MMSPHSSPPAANAGFRLRHLLPYLVLCLVLGTSVARAQLSVTLQTNKSQYVQHEGVLVTLSVRNISGRPLVLEGPGGGNWYTFQIQGPARKLLAPYRAEPKGKPVYLKVGETISKQVIVSDYFSLRDLGRYELSGGAYFRGLSRFIKSNDTRFQVLNARHVWDGVTGASGPGGVTRYVKYSLMSFSAREGKEIYVKLEDEKKGTVLATYSLGGIIDVNDPEAIIDREGQLHVLFMRGRGSFVYHTVRPNGVPMKPIYYRSAGATRPTLKVLRDNGEAYVIGGLEYDPNTPIPSLKDSMRQLSERPAFLIDRIGEE